ALDVAGLGQGERELPQVAAPQVWRNCCTAGTACTMARLRSEAPKRLRSVRLSTPWWSRQRFTV
ncbi:MAG TPA: hypothetical protein VEJ84_23745, partial [Acidimicrobiales bacterium]|nr:hypothetical protein [Acidimicrobiales bacterium]